MERDTKGNATISLNAPQETDTEIVSGSDYLKYKSDLKKIIRVAVTLSYHMNGTKTENGRQYWSSILFTKLVVSSITLKEICPSPGKNSHWDFSSVASIARSNAELWLFFVWLCVETIDDDEWYFRIRVFWLMDNRARFRLMEEIGDDPKEHEYLQRQIEIRHELDRSKIFRSLTDKRKNEIMKGDKHPYIQDEILDRIGKDKKNFRGYYRYLSSFVHTGPVSVFRMQEHNRGNGDENPYDRSAISAAIMFSGSILAACIDQMMALHPDAAVKTIQNIGQDTIELINSFKAS